MTSFEKSGRHSAVMRKFMFARQRILIGKEATVKFPQQHNFYGRPLTVSWQINKVFFFLRWTTLRGHCTFASVKVVVVEFSRIAMDPKRNLFVRGKMWEEAPSVDALTKHFTCKYCTERH